MHKINLVRVHCVPEEHDIWFQRTSTSNTGWDLEAPHLFLREKDVTVGSQAQGLGTPSGVQGFDALLQHPPGSLLTTVQAEDPETKDRATECSLLGGTNLLQVLPP